MLAFLSDVLEISSFLNRPVVDAISWDSGLVSRKTPLRDTG